MNDKNIFPDIYRLFKILKKFNEEEMSNYDNEKCIKMYFNAKGIIKRQKDFSFKNKYNHKNKKTNYWQCYRYNREKSIYLLKFKLLFIIFLLLLIFKYFTARWILFP
ncbi:hypothetical protein EHP00_2651 [Ecytonucleospora hepatopenaei]|uniref:Uncharacterized protein n=1 Tax=Ecytonucleospora hepatopenaei TaxID=646526 RepID=A0A1W0E2L6_9MICR|nr:hypothetical protein EHP00_2651 [Ecytonucleospora hepatopenaei]